LFIADGIPKLDEEIRKVFPRADFQLCTIHASGNFESEIREYDVNAVDSQLKQIFLSEDREEAIKRFNEFKSIWEGKYPKAGIKFREEVELFIYIFPVP
jgi:Transposase and inactivated derivatives